ncbi:MAG: ABC transporter ATP-binding protein [Thermoanaerobaculia bacterium]
MHAIELRGISKRFGSRQALDAVDLHVAEGEVLGLLGPNGAGKSTLVRTIMGRVAPDAGSVTIFGEPAGPADGASRARVGFVPQEIALYDRLTARENLLLFGRYLGIEPDQLESRADRALTWAALEDRGRDRVSTFSGGMKRRLNMAVGIIHDPALLLLDEPTVGVDPQSRERIYSMVEELRSRRVAVIYTTHYMEEAERLCDRIAVVDHGRIIANGTKDELVNTTLGRGRLLVVDVSHLDPAAARAFEAEGATIAGSRLTVAVDGTPQMLKIIERLNASGAEVVDMTMQAPSLERVFLHLTGRELRE